MKILVDIISEIKSSIGINRSAVMLPVIPTNPKKKKKRGWEKVQNWLDWAGEEKKEPLHLEHEND